MAGDAGACVKLGTYFLPYDLHKSFVRDSQTPPAMYSFMHHDFRLWRVLLEPYWYILVYFVYCERLPICPPYSRREGTPKHVPCKVVHRLPAKRVVVNIHKSL